MSEENVDNKKTDMQQRENQPTPDNSRPAMIFAGVWALIFGFGLFARLDNTSSWQDFVITGIYAFSAVSYLIVFFLFLKRKYKLGRIVSLIAFSLQMITSILQGGGNSLLVLFGTATAYVMMFAFLVVTKESRNRFMVGGLLYVALLAVVNQIPNPLREIYVDTDGGVGVQVSVAIGIIAGILVLTQIRRGIQQFQRSTAFKLGVGFATLTLVTVSFMVYAVNVLFTIGVSFDGIRYADNNQIYVTDLMANVRDMEVHVYEYLLKYQEDGLEEAYANYIGEFEYHYFNSLALFEQIHTLHEEGWGDYVPDETEAGHITELQSVRADLETINGMKDQLVELTTQRGFGTVGLVGELNQASRSIENSAAFFTQNAELQGLVSKMRSYEKTWILNQDEDDAIEVNSMGTRAISFMKRMDVSSSDRVAAEKLINNYLDKFNELVVIEKEISSLVDEFDRVVQPIDPVLIEFSEEAAAEVDAAQLRLNATSDRVRNTAIAFGVGSVLVAALAAWLITRTIVRPISSLTATASDLAEGQLDARSDVKTQDETGTLAGVFNQMADRLQNTLTGLETAVAERTAELEERAKEMEASQRVTFAASERTTPDDFLELLVNLLVDQFDVYHAQVYLVDDDHKNAVLSQSTGYAGRVLLQRDHHIPLERESLVTRSINTGEPVLVANTLEEAGWLANELLPHTQSELVVPLKIDGQVIGALDIQDRVASRFTEETVPVFQSMTEQVAFLYQNNELLEEIEASRSDQERFAKQLATAAFIANQLGSILELDQLLNQAVTMLQSQFNLYHAHIYLLDEEKENLVVQAGSGHVGVILKDRGHSIPVDKEESLVARSFRNSQPILVEDVTLADGFMPNPLLPDTRSELAVPLISRGKVIGVLDIQDENVARFTEVDANTMNTLAVQMATAIENAQLFVQTTEERERFEALITYAPDAILMLNYETYKWEDANRNAEAMFGMTRSDLLKIGPGEVSPQFQPDGRESGEKAVELIGTAVAGGDSQFEWVHMDKDGYEFNCEIRLALLPGDDKHLLVNITDITDRKAAQDTIIEGDKLKSEFLANMSHELRTPLNSIVGYTDVLLMGIDGELNEEMLLDVEAIKENSSLLLKIINDILDLAKIEAKRVIFELSEVEMKEVLNNVVRNNAGLLVNKPVEMVVDVLPNLPKIEVDAMRVEQVLNNLVSNAAKFTEEGTITLRAFTEPNWMVMQVEDTGCGMNDEDLQVIFEEFRQADGSQTRTADGTGLGLAITSRLVNMHSGTIEVASEFGKGSTFTVRLPLETKISPEVSVKEMKTEVKNTPKPVAKTAETAKEGKTVKSEKAVKKDTGALSADLATAAGMFGDELKKAMVSPDGEIENEDKKASKAKSNGKNGAKK